MVLLLPLPADNPLDTFANLVAFFPVTLGLPVPNSYGSFVAAVSSGGCDDVLDSRHGFLKQKFAKLLNLRNTASLHGTKVLFTSQYFWQS